MTLDLGKPDSWPLSMRAAEVSYVLRISRRSLYDRIAKGQFPKPDSRKTWEREFVVRYLSGGYRKFEREAERQQRRGTLQMVAR